MKKTVFYLFKPTIKENYFLFPVGTIIMEKEIFADCGHIRIDTVEFLPGNFHNKKEFISTASKGNLIGQYVISQGGSKNCNHGNIVTWGFHAKQLLKNAKVKPVSDNEFINELIKKGWKPIK